VGSATGFVFVGPTTAEITIIDDEPTISVWASDAYARETDASTPREIADDGQFIFSRGEAYTLGNVTVEYEIVTSLSDGNPTETADYTQTLSGSVTIGPGQSTAKLTITPVDDSIVEWDEILEVRITNVYDNISGQYVSAYDDTPARITILDNDEIGGLLNRNVDTESTGLTKEAISNGTVAVDVQGGQATLVLPLIARGLSPTYQGDDNLLPILAVEMKLPESSATPSALKAQLTFGGIASEEVEFSNFEGTETDTLRFVLLGDAAIAEQLRTGHYDYDIKFTAEVGSDEITRTIRGSTELFNRVNDEIGDLEFGKKWWLPGLDRVVVDDGNSARLAAEGLAAIGGAAPPPPRRASPRCRRTRAAIGLGHQK
jgi:hypothetical protein